ncbi:MAG TPA: hypothetical protein VM582_06325, partial [Candidatus Thermoplasmatota archaeon]|nr:hypothetical protein [Candidatus Thermoplasmatota archaeon]
GRRGTNSARFARDRRAEFVPLRPIAPRPGLFARHRMRKAAKRAQSPSHEAFARAFAAALSHAWDPAAEVDAAQKRLVGALTEGRAPVVAVVQAHRAEAYLAAARATGRIPA